MVLTSTRKTLSRSNMKFRYATPEIYGTAIFARYEGKLYLVGTPVAKPNFIGPWQHWVKDNIVVNIPLLRKVN